MINDNNNKKFNKIRINQPFNKIDYCIQKYLWCVYERLILFRTEVRKNLNGLIFEVKFRKNFDKNISNYFN